MRSDHSPFALLLVDVQVDFWTSSYAAAFPEFPARVAALLRTCRSADIEVIHLRAGFASDQSDWPAVYRLKGSIPCVEGTKGVDFLPEAAPIAGEVVFTKRCFDGFLVPELEAHLRAGQRRVLLTAGIQTSVCVLLTSLAAVQRDFLVAVVEDCCADAPQMHEAVMAGYGFALGRTTSDRILESLREWSAQLEELEGADFQA